MTAHKSAKPIWAELSRQPSPNCQLVQAELRQTPKRGPPPNSRRLRTRSDTSAFNGRAIHSTPTSTRMRPGHETPEREPYGVDPPTAYAVEKHACLLMCQVHRLRLFQFVVLGQGSNQLFSERPVGGPETPSQPLRTINECDSNDTGRSPRLRPQPSNVEVLRSAGRCENRRETGYFSPGVSSFLQQPAGFDSPS